MPRSGCRFAHVSVPFAKGRQLLLLNEVSCAAFAFSFSPLREGASITSVVNIGIIDPYPWFQSPSRRGVNYFQAKSVSPSIGVVSFSPLREGASITSLITSRLLLPLLCFSPLREGASITSDVELHDNCLYISFSPLREGASITSRRSLKGRSRLAFVSVPFAKGRQLLRSRSAGIS